MSATGMSATGTSPPGPSSPGLPSPGLPSPGMPSPGLSPPGRSPAPATSAERAALYKTLTNPVRRRILNYIGRHREAKLLEYLDVGSQEERDAVRNGRLLDGSPRANRTALKMSDLTGVDFTRDEE